MAAAALNGLYSILLRNNDSRYTLSVYNHPLPRTASEQVMLNYVYISLMCMYACVFISFRLLNLVMFSGLSFQSFLCLGSVSCLPVSSLSLYRRETLRFSHETPYTLTLNLCLLPTSPNLIRQSTFSLSVE